MENRRVGLNKITRTLNLEGKCIDMVFDAFWSMLS